MASDRPERKYGVVGDLHYYVEPSLDEEDGHYQWTVTVLLGEEEEVAGWYWYDDNEIVVQALDPFESLEEQLAKIDQAIEDAPGATHEVVADEDAAIARILRDWKDVELVD